MYFLQNLPQFRSEHFISALNLENLFEHPSKKVRATLFKIFQDETYRTNLELHGFENRLLSDTDDRVRSNILDHLYMSLSIH